MDLGLRDKVVMVAGASQGLGGEIAKVLLQEGARVAIASREQAKISATAERLRAETNGEVEGFACDVQSPEQIEAWVAQVKARFGRIDGIVVNAGGPPPGTFDLFDDAVWEGAFQLTLMSAVRMIRAVLPAMREAGGGSIVTLTSSSIKEPIDNLLLSNVFRAGVASLAKSLSRTLAGENIRVNNLVPGLIATERLDSLIDLGAEANSRSRDEQIGVMQQPIPMTRFGTPEEFAKAGVFLLSEAASYMTGATVVVDGGAMKSVF